jgi:hypothetical protein
VAPEQKNPDTRAIVRRAWDSLPPAGRELLETIGAAQWEIVAEPLGVAADDYLRSAGHAGFKPAVRDELDRAFGVWIRELRIVLIRVGHAEMQDLDVRSREMHLSQVAWHEWAHALSLERCSRDDVAAGERLLELAPEGVRERIRRAGYSRKELTYELIADIYTLLMVRRQASLKGRPSWLNEEIHEIVVRTTGWND